MTETQKQIDELLEEAHEVEEAKKDVLDAKHELFNEKSDLNIRSVGMLLMKLNEHTSEMAEIAHKKKYYDENLTTALQKTVSDLATAFSQIKAPNINIDFKPLQNIANTINQSNQTIISLLNKFQSSGGNSDELYRLVTAMVAKNNAFVEKSFEQFDYTKNFEGIEAALKNMGKKATEWETSIAEYNRDGRISKFITKLIK